MVDSEPLRTQPSSRPTWQSQETGSCRFRVVSVLGNGSLLALSEKKVRKQLACLGRDHKIPSRFCPRPGLTLSLCRNIVRRDTDHRDSPQHRAGLVHCVNDTVLTRPDEQGMTSILEAAIRYVRPKAWLTNPAKVQESASRVLGSEQGSILAQRSKEPPFAVLCQAV